MLAPQAPRPRPPSAMEPTPSPIVMPGHTEGFSPTSALLAAVEVKRTSGSPAATSATKPAMSTSAAFYGCAASPPRPSVATFGTTAACQPAASRTLVARSPPIAPVPSASPGSHPRIMMTKRAPARFNSDSAPVATLFSPTTVQRGAALASSSGMVATPGTVNDFAAADLLCSLGAGAVINRNLNPNPNPNPIHASYPSQGFSNHPSHFAATQVYTTGTAQHIPTQAHAYPTALGASPQSDGDLSSEGDSVNVDEEDVSEESGSEDEGPLDIKRDDYSTKKTSQPSPNSRVTVSSDGVAKAPARRGRPRKQAGGVTKSAEKPKPAKGRKKGLKAKPPKLNPSCGGVQQASGPRRILTSVGFGPGTATAAKNPDGERKFSSTFFGVSWHKSSQRWAVQIRHDGKRIHVGYYMDEVSAAKAYDEVAKRLRGKDTRTNFTDDGQLIPLPESVAVGAVKGPITSPKSGSKKPRTAKAMSAGGASPRAPGMPSPPTAAVRTGKQSADHSKATNAAAAKIIARRGSRDLHSPKPKTGSDADALQSDSTTLGETLSPSSSYSAVGGTSHPEYHVLSSLTLPGAAAATQHVFRLPARPQPVRSDALPYHVPNMGIRSDSDSDEPLDAARRWCTRQPQADGVPVISAQKRKALDTFFNVDRVEAYSRFLSSAPVGRRRVSILR